MPKTPRERGRPRKNSDLTSKNQQKTPKNSLDSSDFDFDPETLKKISSDSTKSKNKRKIIESSDSDDSDPTPSKQSKVCTTRSIRNKNTQLNRHLVVDESEDETQSNEIEYESKSERVPIQPDVVFFNDGDSNHVEKLKDRKKFKDSSCLNYSSKLWWRKVCSVLACKIM